MNRPAGTIGHLVITIAMLLLFIGILVFTPINPYVPFILICFVLVQWIALACNMQPPLIIESMPLQQQLPPTPTPPPPPIPQPGEHPLSVRAISRENLINSATFKMKAINLPQRTKLDRRIEQIDTRLSERTR